MTAGLGRDRINGCLKIFGPGRLVWTASMGNKPVGDYDEFLLTGGKNRNVNLWDWDKEEPGTIELKRAHSNIIWAIEQYSSRLFASSGIDKNINIWNVNSMKKKKELKGHKDVVRVLRTFPNVFKPKYLLSGCADKTIKVWNVESGTCEKTLRNYCSEVGDIRPISNKSFASSNSASINLWDMNKMKIYQKFKAPRGHYDWVVSLQYDPTLNLLFSGGWDGNVKAWDPRKKGLLVNSAMSVKHKHQVTTICYFPTKRWISAGDNFGALISWDIKKLKKPIICRRDKKSHTSAVSRIVWLEGSSEQFASCGLDGNIKIWDVSKLSRSCYSMSVKDSILGMEKFVDIEGIVTEKKKKKWRIVPAEHIGGDSDSETEDEEGNEREIVDDKTGGDKKRDTESSEGSSDEEDEEENEEDEEEESSEESSEEESD